MTSISVDVVSDVMCPWCYVGKKRLATAIASIPEIDVVVSWRPFQLDPTLPPEGRDRRAYLAAKFGSTEAAGNAYAAIREAGREEGIPFDFDAIAVSPNTLDAHRLIRWADSSGNGVQDRLVEVLFRIYFTQGRNIGDRAVLLDAAQEAEMDVSLTEAMLQAGTDEAEVGEEIATAQRMGVTGVPCFILDQKYAVMGAQPAETLADALRQLAVEKSKTAVQ